MANNVRGNKVYIDTTGQVSTTRTKVAYILFTPDAADDEIVLRESSTDEDIVTIKGSVAKQTALYDFALVPLVFNSGIYVQSLSTGAIAVLVTTNKGTD